MLTRGLSIPFLLCATACSSEGQEAGTSTDTGRSDAPAAAGGAIAGARVIGTIQATIDDEERTWYVLETEIDGTPEASAFWYEPEPGKPQVLIGGYDAPDVAFHTAGAPASDYTGSSISLIISFDPGEIGNATRLPADNGTGVFYMPSVVEGPLFGIADGRLEVSSLHAPRSGTGEVAGTFSGTMQIPPGSERTLTVTDGRFEIEAFTYREELPGGGRW